jgi:hypothetical protein
MEGLQILTGLGTHRTGLYFKGCYLRLLGNAASKSEWVSYHAMGRSRVRLRCHRQTLLGTVTGYVEAADSRRKRKERCLRLFRDRGSVETERGDEKSAGGPSACEAVITSFKPKG